MIFDTALYSNELEILKLRMAILDGQVDAHLMVEGDRTFQGQKRIIQQDLIGDHLYWGFVALPEKAESPWEREYAQRNAIKDELLMFEVSPKDVILISDVDEIPNPDKLEEAAKFARLGEVVCFQQVHTYFTLDLVDDEPWFGTRAISWERLQQTCPQDIRSVKTAEGQYLIRDGGWHFGWTGGNQAIREKVASFCHDDLADPSLMSESYLNHCRKEGRTVHNSHKLHPIDPKLLPKVVQQNPDAYKHLMS